MKDQINHETLYPCSPSKPDITSSCWSFARNETAAESCIIQLEPCDDVQSDESNSTDQSEADDELKNNCMKIMDDIEIEDLKFYDSAPVICKDQMSYFFVGLSSSEIKNEKLNLQHVPGDLLNYMVVYYKAGEPEMDSKNLQIDYEGTEFDEPEILPDISEKNWCNGEENGDGDTDNKDSSNSDSNGNVLLTAAPWYNSGRLARIGCLPRNLSKLYQKGRKCY